MARPEDNSTVQGFIAWLQETRCYSVAGPASDSRRAFVPVKAVETYLEENRNARLNSILAAVYYPKEPPTYAEAILKRYTAVFCILLEIGKGDCIHNFTEHESLRDAQLPFDPSDPPAHFLTAFEDAAPATYEQFCNKQWKYAVPILHRSLNQRFSVDRILPIVSKEPIKKSLDVSIFRIRIHEDYNFLRPWKSRFDDSPDTNLFALKTFRAREDYDDEVAAFKNIKHDQGVIGFCGTYVQDNAFNVIFEYADRGTLDEYFQQVHPPTTQQDTIKFWRELFAIIRGLGATYKAAHDPALPRSMSACWYESSPVLPSSPDIYSWHLDVEPSKILVASQNTANPYEVRFLLTGLCTNQFAGLRSGGTCPSAVNSYGAPEYSKIVPGAKLHDFHPKQSADIWSLGCVFSEAATWIVSGYEGTQRYRRKRKDEVDMRGRFASRPYFHDGLGILDTVQDHHRLLLDMLRSQDDISRSVVSLMIEEMLEVPEGRPNADQLWYKAQRILSKAEDQCAASTDNKSERSQSTVVFRSPAQIFSPIKDEVEAANVTTPIPFEDPDQQESSINLVAVKSSCLTRENDVSQTLPGSQSEIETCRECNNIQDFRGYIEEPKYVSGTESFSSTNSSTTVSSHADSDTSSGLGSRQQNEPLPELSISISAEVSKTLETSLQTTDFKIQPRKNSIQLPTEIISSHPSNVPYCSVADALVWKSKNKQRHQNSKVMPGPLLYRLGKREHIFLIDDAVSMRHHTKEVRNVLEALSYMIKEDNPEGIHLYFTNSTEHCESKHTKKLLAMLDRARYQGQTRILDSLLRIKYDHVSRVDGGASTKALTFSRAMSPQRTQRNIPLTIYILTDGAWIENASPEETIKMINEIFELRDRSPPLALQFISFEGNKACEERLRLLTLELSNIRVVKSTGSVWDMLSGFVSSEVKNESGSMFRRLRTIRRSFSIKSTNSDNRTEPRGFEENFAIYHAGHGLAVWNSAESPTVDIVFIHGLDGGREKSWSFQPVNTINGLCWPKHLLTQNLPKARVLSYGYDSAPWRSYPIEDVISMQATELLTMLCAQRDESTRRPLIFVALDTGGLILKSALLQSHLSMDPNAKSMNAIKVSTTGILLLDPPEIQVSGNIAIPELLKPSDAAGSGCDPRMVTAQDLAWLKLQLDSFQSISECFSLYYVHKSAHQAKVPVQSVDILNQYGVNSNTESKAVPEQPSKDLISTAGEPNRPSTFRSHVSFRVERVYGFHDAIDPDYKKVEDAIFCLYNEGAEKCRQNWMLYLHDQETT
ncbi:hypothetical protein BDZ45DRAFT_186822 [Acephala macrosclerotiorum]|nr:hypothetical protein BDZ45DRAFT_186822 [Acephala macrosclerotiorum]